MTSRILNLLLALGLTVTGAACGTEEADKEKETPEVNDDDANGDEFDGNLTGEETDPAKLVMQMTIGVGNSVPQTFALTPAGSNGQVLVMLPDAASSALMVPETEDDTRTFDFLFRTDGLHSYARKKTRVEAHLDTFYVQNAETDVEPTYGLLHEATAFEWTKPSETSYSFHYSMQTAGLQEYMNSLRALGEIEEQHLTFIFRDDASDEADALVISIPLDLQF